MIIPNMQSPPNVIILVCDTLRPDYLSCYGGSVDTTAFDDTASKGVQFEKAFAAGPGTPISHAALYSGQYPSETGVAGNNTLLPDDIPLLASHLNNNGYDTYGITGPAKMGSDWNYDRGFDELFEPYYDIGSRPSKEYFKNILFNRSYLKDFIRMILQGERDYTRFKFDHLRSKINSELEPPFFVLCNQLTVHAPYDPPRPYKERSTPTFSRPKWYFLEYLLNNPYETDNEDIRIDRVFNIQTSDGLSQYLYDPEYLNDIEEQLVQDWYAASVKYLNDELASFLEYYERELLDDTILILTADHGEQLGEHGLREHSFCLFDETLHIPLIMRGPGLPEGEVRSDLVSQVDLFPSICDLCGLRVPSDISGKSAFDGDQRSAVFMEHGKRDPESFVNKSSYAKYLETEQLKRLTPGRKAVRTENYRYEMLSDGRDRFYNLPSQDPVEDPPSDVVESLEELLVDTLGRDFPNWSGEKVEMNNLSEGVEDNLRELGYID